MTGRDDIAEALSLITGISGQPTPPRTPARGIGWPEWQATEPLSYTAHRVRWAVHVTLPPGLDDADVSAPGGLIEQIIDALEPVGDIEQLEPSTVLITKGGGQELPAITTTITTLT